MTVRQRFLMAVLRGLAILLILRVLAAIVANYPDYFPPNFDSLFLQGREATFNRTYRLAFYAHIVCGPLVLVSGLILLSETVRRHWSGAHRRLGRVHAILVLSVLVPSSAVMSRDAFGGWPAGLSFLTLAMATAICVVWGVTDARRRNYAWHRLWMLRSYLLICSAVMLRIASGLAEAIGVSDPEAAYIVAAWGSWLIPLAAFEAAVPRRWQRGTSIRNLMLADVPGSQGSSRRSLP